MDIAQQLAGWPLKDLAGWTASVATIIGALMTASNLGSRITGWGFVSFTIGSAAWALLGVLSQEQSLLVTNLFLALVNALGVWRWLGHKAQYEKAANDLANRSRAHDRDSLLPVSSLPGAVVTDNLGNKAGTVVEAMLGCNDGNLSQVVIAASNGAIAAEELRAVDGKMVRLTTKGLKLSIDRAAFIALPVLDKADWNRTEGGVNRRNASPPPAA